MHLNTSAYQEFICRLLLRSALFIACFNIFVDLSGPTSAADNPTSAVGNKAATTELISFDIPAQPLASALNAYGAITGLELFYDGDLAVGRRSAAVFGMFAPQDALRRLLEGTDFVAQMTDIGAITISAPDSSFTQELTAIKNRSMGYWPYLALIQASLRNALCRHPVTQSDAQDRLIRFWISASGSVARSELLTPDGTRDRDAAYIQVIEGLNIGQPPPGMPQPITMMIMARSSPQAAGCETSGHQATIR
jgi:hypothetical protein